LGNDARTIQESALCLARAYLLAGQPLAANQALYNARQSFHDPDATRLAAVLGSYARFLGTTASVFHRNEVERLLTELTQIHGSPSLKAEDAFLLGQAYNELGFEIQARDLIENSMAQARSPYWQHRLTFELAGILHRNGESDAALSLLTVILADSDSNLFPAALLRKAQIELLIGAPEACTETCRRLLQLPLNASDKKAGLDLMGQAYRSLNLHYSAALCYAGSLPTDETGEQPPTGADQ
jgi:hypothetical protein